MNPKTEDVERAVKDIRAKAEKWLAKHGCAGSAYDDNPESGDDEDDAI